MDMEDLYESYLDAQHFESEYKVRANQHRRNRREKRELKLARNQTRIGDSCSRNTAPLSYKEMAK